MDFPHLATLSPFNYLLWVPGQPLIVPPTVATCVAYGSLMLFTFCDSLSSEAISIIEGIWCFEIDPLRSGVDSGIHKPGSQVICHDQALTLFPGLRNTAHFFCGGPYELHPQQAPTPFQVPQLSSSVSTSCQHYVVPYKYGIQLGRIPQYVHEHLRNAHFIRLCYYGSASLTNNSW